MSGSLRSDAARCSPVKQLGKSKKNYVALHQISDELCSPIRLPSSLHCSTCIAQRSAEAQPDLTVQAG